MAGLLDLAADEQGFGGDLSYNGKSGVLGADELCAALAERSMKGSSARGWKAFLSTSSEHALDRIAVDLDSIAGRARSRPTRRVSP
jgi:hypothetical protein